MSLFSASKSYLGIDIGASSIKITELKDEKGRPKLLTYGFVDQENDLLHNDSEEKRKKIIGGIKLIQKKARTTSNRVIAALPSYTVFSSIIQLPVMSKKDLTSAVRWEAKKFVPMPIEEMILDWKILENFSGENFEEASSIESAEETKGNEIDPAAYVRTIKGKNTKYLKILLTAAPKNLVAKYIDIMKAVGCQLISLETEAFALERALIGHDGAAIMVIDIGAMATNMSVMVNSIPLINRSIDLGGNTITKVISNSLNIDMKRAEQFKRDFGLNMNKESGETSQVPNRIEFMMSSIVNEIRYMMNLYNDQYEKPIEKVILAGGSAWLPNLPSYLNNILNLRVFIGDPWARVVYPVELKPVLNEIGPSFAVSIGLAMREIV